MVELRAGVRAAYLVRRRLRLVSNTSWSPATVLPQLQELVGFNDLKQREQRLYLEYDAGKLQLDALLAQLNAARAPLLDNRRQRLRLGWYRYLDANILANSRDSSSSCCSQSPLRHR
ncbi:hypothetical protein [Motiliproteus sp. SC1-56]|uniref:hypothetical protein n=1 Tax=Motiliproteus sp. SC1-56 TaxID=2799565 RepID=UPI001A8C8A24|nr:hypothetical protein [Motiliproteus sp. SC1-56]